MPTPSKAQIKVNALARLVVEYREYLEEEHELSESLQRLEETVPRDTYEIKRVRLVLDETKRVRARVLQMMREHAADVKKAGGAESKSPKAVEALEQASKFK